MKSTGMSRELDGLGRIVIPKELRNTLDINNGDPVTFLAGDGQIAVKKYSPGCIFCSEVDNVVQFHNYKICSSCLTQLSNLANDTNSAVEI
jgi:AbrB family transcriptional regulator, transcriptional pleiotropic regulator of transition state genes